MDARLARFTGRMVRFMFEHGHAWPLREIDSDKYAMELRDDGISCDLTERLRSCYDLWEAHRRLDGQGIHLETSWAAERIG